MIGIQPPDQRQDDVLPDQMPEPFVVRMHRNRRIAEHGFGERGCDDDEARRINGIEGLALDRIAQKYPQAALDLDLLHLEIGNRR